MGRRIFSSVEYIAAPTLFALFPIFILSANNIHEIEIREPVRAIAVSILMALILFGIVRLVLRDGYRAALIVSVSLLLFFSYGHLYETFKSIPATTLTLGRHRYLSSLFLAIMMGWSWLVLKRMASPSYWNQQAILVGVIALIYPALIIGRVVIPRAIERYQVKNQRVVSVVPINEELPDIYYIILDGYGRADVLEDLYGFDNENFLSALEDLGFFIADESLSNYNTTRLSLASSLNFEYVQSIAAAENAVVDQSLAEELIWNSHLVNYLKRYGYQTVAFDSGRPWSSINTADYYFKAQEVRSQFKVSSQPIVLNLFETLLIKTTFLNALIDATELFGQFNQSRSAAANEEHRIRIVYGLEKLQEIPGWDGNYFTFLHVITPHPPFVFNAEGERVDPDIRFTFSDGSHYVEIASREEYIKGYIDQLKYTNTIVLNTIQTILETSDSPPIIIIQGDHGPGAYLDWEAIENSNLLERHAILNVIYAPDGRFEDFYPGISPVNTFAVLLNTFFDGEFKLHPDRQFFTEKHAVPVTYKLIEVTGSIK